MIRTLNFCLTLLALFLTTFCMAQKSELKFNKDGKFKIVQFGLGCSVGTYKPGA